MSYKTVNNYARVEYIEKKSRFIGSISPVKTQDEARGFIDKVSSEFKDATHNVYAYILRDGSKRYSDNGEPQGTAGVPSLDVLQKEGICDVCVVVTRYFGGILLGGGGLVRAYSHSAKLAVDAGRVITMSPCLEFCVECEYQTYGKLSYILPSYGAVVMTSDFADDVKLRLLIEKLKYDKLINEITELSNGKIVPHSVCEVYKNIEKF